MTRALQRAEQVAPSAGYGTFVFAAVICPAVAFSMAVAAVRQSPRGWTGRTFRKNLWLIPLSPLIIVIGFIGFLLTTVGIGLNIASNGFRALFEKATGQQTYRRQRIDAKYYGSKDSQKGDDAPPK